MGMEKKGLALSGGGIKSFSQIPVIQAIEHENIHLDAISGTSMGSVIAALYAVGMSADELMDVVLELEEETNEMKLFQRNPIRILTKLSDRFSSGLVDGQIFEEMLQKYLDRYHVRYMKDVKIPLAIPAVDMITGKIIVFVSHPELFTPLEDHWEVVSDVTIAKAVRASCSFPFAIDACPLGEYKLTDGGVRMNLPSPLLKAYGVDEVIAVTMHNEEHYDKIDSFTGLANRMMELMRQEHDLHVIKEDVDVLINVPLHGVWVFEVGKGRYTMEMGERAVNKKMSELKELNRKKSWFEKLLKRSE